MSENSLRGFIGGETGRSLDSEVARGGLEGSCGGVAADRLRVMGGRQGIEHIEAAFTGDGFSPHRHDTYGIAVTLSGVQTFHYRGFRRASLPGNVIVLHPDELHDGAAGTEDGLVYRMIYVAPDKIAAALGHRGALPFVPDPVVHDPVFRARLAEAMALLDEDAPELEVAAVVATLADGLQRHSDDRGAGAGAGISTAISACRDHLAACCEREVRSEELEALAGLDRYTIARQFRRAYGTSPHRYQIMRRLDLARALMRGGDSLAETAIAAGFADQAHFTRHFRQAYGMTPGRWLELQKPV